MAAKYSPGEFIRDRSETAVKIEPAVAAQVPYADEVFRPTPESELSHRWAAVRSAMAFENLDALIFSNQTDGLGGYVRWIGDLVVGGGGYPITVIFSIDEPMTVIMHGPRGSERTLDPETDPISRGIGRIFSTASFTAAAYTATDDAALMVKALRRIAHRRVGLIGWGQMSYPAVMHLKSELPATEFTEASHVIDPIKAIKSDWEIDAIKRSAAMQDSAFAAILAHAEVGMRDSDILDIAVHHCLDAGSDGGVTLAGSGSHGRPGRIMPRKFQNRRIQTGDHLVVLIERNGPDGQYTELGRTLYFGQAPDELHEEFAFTVQAQDFSAGLLVPGARPADAFRAYNQFLQEHGLQGETRVHSHGQGYDIVERPLIREDETMLLAEGMNIAVHPMYERGGVAFWTCDNYMIEASGPGPRLHTTDRKLFEIR